MHIQQRRRRFGGRGGLVHVELQLLAAGAQIRDVRREAIAVRNFDEARRGSCGLGRGGRGGREGQRDADRE